jgi:hypothetical protein
MKADLATRLRRSMRGGIYPKNWRRGVTGVAGVLATCDKSLTLQWLCPLRLENDRLANDVIRGVVRGVAVLNDADEAGIGIAEIEAGERIGMAAGSVAEPYLDAWARIQCHKPMQVSDEEWRQAIDDAGKFLDTWSSLALEFGWTTGDLFDVPRDGSPGGLVWFLVGETVRALRPALATTESGRDFSRARG